MIIKVAIWLVSLLGVSGAVVYDAGVKSETAPLNNHDAVQYKDCGHLLKAGYNISGVHVLWMNKTTPFLIHCEFTKDSAFNVIQRRSTGLVSFAQNLNTYIQGFGSAQSDYWAGLNAINYLTSAQRNNVLTIYMQDWNGQNQNARYSYFQVRPQDNRYQLIVSGYSGTLIDDFSYQNGMTFQTFDYPDTYQCAVHMNAGWWYNYCAYTLLNGRYYSGGPYVPKAGYYDGIYWKDWKGYDYSLKFVTMQVSTS